jgi:hypothetical protein
MGREKETEKKFAEYLDRILAGEEIKAGPAMDEELRAALDFARKMKGLGAKPAAQYQTRLKASLLQKLEEREAQKKAARDSFWNIFRSHPVWQGAAAVLAVIILLSIIWRAGFFQPPIPVAAPAATAQPAPVTTAALATKTPAATTAAMASTVIPVNIEAKTDKSVYQSGEEVKIELAMRNITRGQLTVTDFPPILSLMDENTKQPVYTFTAGKQTIMLAPNDAATYTYTWKQVNFNGQPVSGSYYIELEDLEYNGNTVKLNLAQPVQFVVR